MAGKRSQQGERAPERDRERVRSREDEHARQRHDQQDSRHKSEPLDIFASPSIRDTRPTVATKHNDVFMLTSPSGDILPEAHGCGLYFRDTQYLDRWEVRLCGEELVPLLSDASRGFECQLELSNPTLTLDGGTIPKERLSVRRTQSLQPCIQDDIWIRNMSQRQLTIELAFAFGSRFSDIFTIRGVHPGRRGSLRSPHVTGNSVVLAYDGADRHRRTTALTFKEPPTRLDGETATYHITLSPRASHHVTVSFELRDEGPDITLDAGGKHVPEARSDRHHTFGQAFERIPVIETDNVLFERTLQRSLSDLRMLATAIQDDVYIAAGIPWYVALFGRDSCISAYQSLAYVPEIARTTLLVLAHYQGTRDDAYQDEEPGKILHELRLGERANLHEMPMVPYYGSVDSTPWFLILLCAYVRWTGDVNLFRSLQGHVARALAWIDHNMRDGLTGFLTYGSRSERGLTNQGWKDAGNSIVNTDGSLAEPPIALIAAQGYVYHAWREVAYLLRLTGDQRQARALEQKAVALKQHFTEMFWMPAKRYYALALERGAHRVESIASNPGQAFFTGMIDADKAQAVADRLLAADMFSGWGVRTLSADEQAYNPLDYQVGSVWPHDNSLIALGLRRYGFARHMTRVFTGMFDAATQMERFRLPEVFDGFSRDEYEKPVPYPVACSPQAWAAGALPLMLQAALGLEPNALERTLHIHSPTLPGWMSSVIVRGLAVGQARVDLRFQREGETTLAAVLRREGDVDVLVRY